MISFEVSGIAGTVGADLTPEVAVSAGRAIGQLYRRAAVSRDAGKSGIMLANALTAGLCSAGCDVTDVGICALPTSILSIPADGCGIMVTSPQSFGGYAWIRLNSPGGASFTPLQTGAVRDLAAGNGNVKDVRHDTIGTVSHEDARTAEHIAAIQKAVGVTDCPVIVDCASGTASLITPRLLAGMGADVRTMNADTGPGAGRMTEHHAYAGLVKNVRSSPGSVGIGHDGNGSRIAVVDEGGRLLNGNTVIALIASHLKADKIAVPISAGMVIDEVVKGNVVRTKVGDNYLSEAMMKNDIRLGGEPSGMFIFGDSSYCPDGIYAAAVIASIATEGSLRQAADELPSYHTGSADMAVSGSREELAKRLDEKIASGEHDRLIKEDGWRVEMPDGWYLIRISNFENKVRVVAEARDKVYMNCLLDIAKDAVASCIR